LARFGEADVARLRRQSRMTAARNFGKTEIRLTGVRDRASAAAAYGANPPAAPPNSRERDNVSALAGSRRRPPGAAVAQSRACSEDSAANTTRKSGSPKLLTANLMNFPTHPRKLESTYIGDSGFGPTIFQKCPKSPKIARKPSEIASTSVQKAAPAS